MEGAIHSPAAPRHPGGALLVHTVVHLAVYDAVVAVEGGYRPYATRVDAPEGADMRAAVATAAHRSARARLEPSQVAAFDDRYAAFMSGIPDGPGKLAGTAAGEAAAVGMLEQRVNDRFGRTVLYECSAEPLPVGEFEPDGGCGTQPIGVAVGQTVPYTFDDQSQFRPDGPDPLSSPEWAADFEEVKAYGGAGSTVRTPEQTDVVHFWNEHGYVHWNRNLIALAADYDLDVVETARLMALVHAAASDAVIAGLEAKYHYRFWRPRTAVPRAAEDGNPATEPDPAWKPLLTVDHPEYPSGHSFWSGAVTRAVALFLGTEDVRWTIRTVHPEVVTTGRTYEDIDALMHDVSDARVWGGLHYRNSMEDGRALGDEVARFVAERFFVPEP
ncbi:MAG: vanadium-dependent haloperoxidase [Actinomycetota bacterium]